MKPENPFRAWLESDPYGGAWVPIARLGWTEPASCPALIRIDAERQALERTDWPLHVDSARPNVWTSYRGEKPEYRAEMHRVEERDGVEFRPFVASFDPYGRPAWLEPIPAFVLHWEAWPVFASDGSITWFEEGDDSQPVAMARWLLERYENESTFGRLEIRRDRLLSFLATFGFDLAIYHAARVDGALVDGWADEGREPHRAWRVWAAAVPPRHRRASRHHHSQSAGPRRRVGTVGSRRQHWLSVPHWHRRQDRPGDSRYTSAARVSNARVLSRGGSGTILC
jgi:hypothetical protein